MPQSSRCSGTGRNSWNLLMKRMRRKKRRKKKRNRLKNYEGTNQMTKIELTLKKDEKVGVIKKIVIENRTEGG